MTEKTKLCFPILFFRINIIIHSDTNSYFLVHWINTCCHGFLSHIQRCEILFAHFMTSFFFFLQICHTYIFQVVKQIVILDRDNLSRYELQFWNDDFIL